MILLCTRVCGYDGLIQSGRLLLREGGLKVLRGARWNEILLLLLLLLLDLRMEWRIRYGRLLRDEISALIIGGSLCRPGRELGVGSRH